MTSAHILQIANPTTIYEDHPEKVPEYVSLETVKGTYIALMSNEMDKSQFLPFDDLVGDKKFARPAFTIPTDKITRYVERLGAGTKQSASGRGHVFFNGKPLPLNAVSVSLLYLCMMSSKHLLGTCRCITGRGRTTIAISTRKGIHLSFSLYRFVLSMISVRFT